MSLPRPMCRAAAMVLAVTSAASAQRVRTVDLRAGDGLLLKGTLYESATPGPAVLMLHQCDEQRKVWEPLGRQLAAKGVTAFTIDYRGYGESHGTPHAKLSNAELVKQQLEQWPADIDSAFAFLLRQPGVDAQRIGGAGGSCGTQFITQVAQRHSGVKALALLAGAVDRAGRMFLATPVAPPVFTMAAADDKYANFVDIMGWYAGRSGRKDTRFATYADGGHAAVVFQKHPGLADTMATWFAIELGAKKGTLPTTNGAPMKAEVARVLEEIDQPGGAERVAQQLIALRRTKPNAQLFPEYFPNQLGYEHMQAGEFGLAAAIMKLNVLAYPASPNAMDSLGDVYLESGNKQAALDAAHKTLDLLKADHFDTEARKKSIRDGAEGKIKQLTPMKRGV